MTTLTKPVAEARLRVTGLTPDQLAAEVNGGQASGYETVGGA